MKILLLFLALVAPSFAAYLPSQARITTIAIPATALLTTGSPADLTSVVIPTQLARYAIKSVYVRATSAAATLELATIDIRTAATGGGSSILNAATALVGLTAAQTLQSVTPMALGSAQTATTLYLRQTIDSGAAGNIIIVIEVIDLS